MLSSDSRRIQAWVFAGAALLVCGGLYLTAQQPPPPEYNLKVLVKEAETGEVISQARLTLTFKSGKLHREVQYGAKTNAQGRYTFSNIPKGTVRLLVTAEHHQSFGKEIDLAEDNQEIEVKLKKPQPQL